jgi:hypothetical protein
MIKNKIVVILVLAFLAQHTREPLYALNFYDNFYALRPSASSNSTSQLESLLGISNNFQSSVRLIPHSIPLKRPNRKLKKRIRDLKDTVSLWGSSLAEVSSALKELKGLQDEGYILSDNNYVGRVDMHMHTIYSDGQFRPAQLVMEYWLQGFTAISITDHNTFDAIKEAIEAARILGIIFIPGAELTVFTDKVKAEKLHILLYWQGTPDEFLEWLNSPEGAKYNKRLAVVNLKAKEKMRKVIEVFNKQYSQDDYIEKYGIQLKLSEDTLRSFFPNGPAKSTDLSRVLFYDYGLNGRVADNVLQTEDIHQTKHKFFKGIHVDFDDSGYNLTLDEAFDIAERGKFKVVFAHPLVRGKWDLPQVRSTIEAYPGRFSGLEVYHSRASYEHIQLLLMLCKEFGLSFSVGSDLHGKFDKNFGINCPSDTLFGRMALEASIDTCELLPEAVLGEVMAGQLLYWASLPLEGKTYSHILPVFSADNKTLGKRDISGNMISVTPEVLDILMKKGDYDRYRDYVCFLLTAILKNDNLNVQSRTKIVAFLEQHDRFPEKVVITKGVLKDKESFRMFAQEFITSLLMDSRFNNEDGFTEDVLFSSQLKSNYNFSDEARSVLIEKLSSGPSRIIKNFRLRGSNSYIFIAKDKAPYTDKQDSERLKRYYMDLFDTALDLFVYVGIRMQLEGDEKDKAIASLSDTVSKLKSLKQTYTQDAFSRKDFRNVALHVSGRINRAIELIEDFNEPAASRCLFGAIRIIYEARAKSYNHKFYKYRKTSTLKSDWDDLRQKITEIDFEVSDRRWVMKTRRALSDINNEIRDKGRELSLEDISDMKMAIDNLIDLSVKPGGELRAENKVIPMKFLQHISLMLGAGARHIKTVRIFIEEACRYLSEREKENIGIIDAVGRIKDLELRRALLLESSSHQPHIEKIHKRQDTRDNDIANQARSIMGQLSHNRVDIAEAMIYRLSDEYRLNLEPEYAGIMSVTEQVLQAIDDDRIDLAIYHVRRIYNMALYSRDFRYIISDYRDHLLKEELLSDIPVNRLDLLMSAYQRYLDGHKKIKSSPKQSALYWAKLYQLANVPMFSQTDTVKQHNKLFDAISGYIAIVKHDTILKLYESSIFSILDLSETQQLISEISLRRNHIIREDLPGIVSALVADFKLSSEETDHLKHCLWISQRVAQKPSMPKANVLNCDLPISRGNHVNISAVTLYRIYNNIKSAA